MVQILSTLKHIDQLSKLSVKKIEKINDTRVTLLDMPTKRRLDRSRIYMYAAVGVDLMKVDEEERERKKEATVVMGGWTKAAAAAVAVAAAALAELRRQLQNTCVKLPMHHFFYCCCHCC
jgi:hypothetical protein